MVGESSESGEFSRQAWWGYGFPAWYVMLEDSKLNRIHEAVGDGEKQGGSSIF